MLGSISQGTVPGYAGTQDDIVYLVGHAQTIAASCQFVVTSGHAVMALSWPFRTDLAELADLPWDKINAKFWFDDAERGFVDRMRPKQAEFLVFERVPWDLIGHMAVKTDAAKARVEQAIARAAHQPQVHVLPKFYY